MANMHSLRSIRVSPKASAVGLLVCAVATFAGMLAWYVNSHTKDGWSSTPLLWMLVLLVCPILCAALGVALVLARERTGSRLSPIDWCALIAGAIAVLLGGWLLIGILGPMRGSGIL